MIRSKRIEQRWTEVAFSPIIPSGVILAGRITMPTITLSDEPLALLRLDVAQHNIRADDSNGEAHKKLARTG
jgi:hypothetical protein